MLMVKPTLKCGKFISTTERLPSAAHPTKVWQPRIDAPIDAKAKMQSIVPVIHGRDPSKEGGYEEVRPLPPHVMRERDKEGDHEG
jgi:hypothetical protein